MSPPVTFYHFTIQCTLKGYFIADAVCSSLVYFSKLIDGEACIGFSVLF